MKSKPVILIIYNLETNNDGLEHEFFKSIRKASVKEQFKKITHFDSSFVHSCKCSGSKSLANDIVKEIENEFSGTDIIVKMVFIIDNDKPESIAFFNEHFKKEKNEILRIISKKTKKVIEFKKIVLPEGGNIHYLFRIVFHSKNDDALFKVLDCRDKGNFTRKLKKMNKKPEGMIGNLQRRHFSENKNFFEILKKGIFNDTSYLNYRDIIKRRDANIETYHWFFDWFEESEKNT